MCEIKCNRLMIWRNLLNSTNVVTHLTSVCLLSWRHSKPIQCQQVRYLRCFSPVLLRIYAFVHAFSLNCVTVGYCLLCCTHAGDITQPEDSAALATGQTEAKGVKTSIYRAGLTQSPLSRTPPTNRKMPPLQLTIKSNCFATIR